MCYARLCQVMSLHIIVFKGSCDTAAHDAKKEKSNWMKSCTLSPPYRVISCIANTSWVVQDAADQQDILEICSGSANAKHWTNAGQTSQLIHCRLQNIAIWVPSQLKRHVAYAAFKCNIDWFHDAPPASWNPAFRKRTEFCRRCPNAALWPEAAQHEVRQCKPQAHIAALLSL